MGVDVCKTQSYLCNENVTQAGVLNGVKRATVETLRPNSPQQ